MKAVFPVVLDARVVVSGLLWPKGPTPHPVKSSRPRPREVGGRGERAGPLFPFPAASRTACVGHPGRGIHLEPLPAPKFEREEPEPNEGDAGQRRPDRQMKRRLDGGPRRPGTRPSHGLRNLEQPDLHPEDRSQEDQDEGVDRDPSR